MLARRIIPCLDMKNGKVVKGVKFQNLREVGHPPDLAKIYEEQGADEVTFLDISASLEGRGTMLNIVSETAKKLFVPLCVGGGIGSVEDVRAVLNAGADKISLNSAAVKDPDVITRCAENFGKQCIVVAIDVKKDGKNWYVHTHGGTRRTELEAVAWAKKVEDLGAGEILLTSMDADGVKTGYDIPITEAIADEVSIPVIASGGCGKIEHIYEVFSQTNASAALAASIFHFNEYTVGDVKQYLKDRGVLVR